MATLSDLKARVIRMTNYKYLDSHHIADMINDALNQLVSGAKLKGTEAISVINGTNTYTLPENFKSPGFILDENNPDCLFTFEKVDISENRVGYAIEGSSIIIKPVPDKDKTLTHHYYKYATALVNDSDVPEIDAQYHDLLATYASGMILLLPQMDQNDRTLSDRYLQRWDEGKASFFMDMNRKNKATTGRVVVQW